MANTQNGSPITWVSLAGDTKTNCPALTAEAKYSSNCPAPKDGDIETRLSNEAGITRAFQIAISKLREMAAA